MIAALFVDKRGPYFGRDDVDAWDIERDARKYDGPHPVVAHPPCQRWGRMARLVESKFGVRVGADDGCFSSALASVRKWGGVLEHPALTLAWPAHCLPRPIRGGWSLGSDGGWVTCVDQAAYGHAAPKASWLYAFGAVPPPLAWIRGNPTMVVGRARNSNKREMPKSQRSITPPAFADLLIAIAHKSARAA